jgi:hypothetical protein
LDSLGKSRDGRVTGCRVERGVGWFDTFGVTGSEAGYASAWSFNLVDLDLDLDKSLSVQGRTGQYESRRRNVIRYHFHFHFHVRYPLWVAF